MHETNFKHDFAIKKRSEFFSLSFLNNQKKSREKWKIKQRHVGWYFIRSIFSAKLNVNFKRILVFLFSFFFFPLHILCALLYPMILKY